ncbi:hypothetical protein NL676_007360 [Syzygium grande]|nr:hypothetical protein NL676_007360 [Syzygium grande]
MACGDWAVGKWHSGVRGGGQRLMVGRGSGEGLSRAAEEEDSRREENHGGGRRMRSDADVYRAARVGRRRMARATGKRAAAGLGGRLHSRLARGEAWSRGDGGGAGG